MGKVFSLARQKASTRYYLANTLDKVLDCISYLTSRVSSTDLSSNKRVSKALGQLKNAAYIIKQELEKAKHDTES